MAKITTPVKGYSGRTLGVQFRDGVAHTDDEAAIAYFKRRGYGVEAEALVGAGEPVEGDQGDGDPGTSDQGDGDPGTSDQGDGTSLFDPSAHNVDRVNEHLAAAAPAERERVLQAEAGGKGRLSILNGPHADIAGLPS